MTRIRWGIFLILAVSFHLSGEVNAQQAIFVDDPAKCASAKSCLVATVNNVSSYQCIAKTQSCPSGTITVSQDGATSQGSKGSFPQTVSGQNAGTIINPNCTSGCNATVPILQAGGATASSQGGGLGGGGPQGNSYGSSNAPIPISFTDSNTGKKLSGTLVPNSDGTFTQYGDDGTSKQLTQAEGQALLKDKAAAAELKDQFKDENDAMKEQYARQGKYEGLTDADLKAQADSGDRDCSISGHIDGKYSCKGTRALITGSQVANMGSMMAGSLATQVMGMNQAYQLSNATSQSGAMRAAANTQDLSAKMQIGVGTMNTGLGVAQLVRGMQHSSHSEEIANGSVGGISVDRATTENNGKYQMKQGRNFADVQTDGTSGDGTISGTKKVTQQILSKWDGIQGTINRQVLVTDQQVQMKQSQAQAACAGGAGMASQCAELQRESKLLQQQQQEQYANRANDVKTKESRVKDQVQRIGSAGASEQDAMSSQAKMGALQSIMYGATQLVGGIFNEMAANQAKQAAAKMAQTENIINAAMAPQKADPLAPPQLAQVGTRSANILSGNGAPATQSAADSNTPTDTSSNGDIASKFGRPTNSDLPPDGVNNAPSPGALVPGQNQPGASGGGGGAIGGGGMPAPADPKSQENPPSQLFAQDGNNMVAGGGARMVGGGGGGGAAGGGGVDLAGMFKGLMGAQEQNPTAGMSIENWVRAPAGQMGGMVLNRGDDLFKHVSDAYMAKVKEGSLGRVN